MVHTKAQILLNQEIAPDHFKMVLQLEGFKGSVKPGQFFHIRAGSDYDPLLRRPLSMHRIGPRYDIIEILYKIVGKGTHLISRRSKGTYLDVIGPLGNGFKIPKEQPNFILIAGGIGIAPLIGLVDELSRFRKRSITVILGCKTKAYVVCEKELTDLGAKIIITTEDASQGQRGMATGVLEDVIESFDIRKAVTGPATKKASGIKTSDIIISDYRPMVGLYACGPIGMIRDVARITKRYRIQAQVSLEEKIGCGIGACLGCVMRTKQGYKRVCKDGPVFDLKELVWD